MKVTIWKGEYISRQTTKLIAGGLHCNARELLETARTFLRKGQKREAFTWYKASKKMQCYAEFIRSLGDKLYKYDSIEFESLDSVGGWVSTDYAKLEKIYKRSAF